MSVIKKPKRILKPKKVIVALIEAIWTMRWNDDETGLYAVLEPYEAEKIANDIFAELDKIGYEIRRKNK